MLGLKLQDNADLGAEIIRKVRENETLSRVEVARELGLAPSTVGRHVDGLVAEGYFLESVEHTNEAGRPPVRLRPNPDKGCFLGVDFHAGRAFATAVDFAQRPLAEKSYALQGDEGVESVLAGVAQALVDMRKATGLPVLAAGIATPGRVDTGEGIACEYPFVPGFDNVPLADRMSAVVKAPVFLENNIRTMALSERWFGENKGCQEMICLGVRIGISVGIIHQGRLAAGHRNLGGEIRDWNCPVFDAVRKKWRWSAGNRLEACANIPAALARHATLSGAAINQENFLKAALAGDKHALTALREVSSLHGWAVAQLLQVTDPEVVILAGALTKLGGLYLNLVTEAAAGFGSRYHGRIPVRLSDLGEYAGAVGAAALALQHWRPES